MRKPLEQFLDGLDDRQQKILLGLLVERLLKNEAEEILFEDAEGRPIGYFVPHDRRMELDRARLIAELEHPDWLPRLNDVVAATVAGKGD